MKEEIRKLPLRLFLGVHPSTITREIKKNSYVLKNDTEPVYNFKRAHEKCCSRRHAASKKPRKINPDNKKFITCKLGCQWSSEQISGRMRREKHPVTVSHETIYKMIWRDKKKGGSIYKNLRHYCKKNRKRGSLKEGRACILNRVDIKERPTIVESKSRVGDWEVDTIIGKGHNGAVATMVERMTKLTKLYVVPRKTASNISNGLISKLLPLKKFVLTITGDNGGEFAKHEDVSTKLDAKFYFATPYHAWERGLNEHVNGLLRQCLPKSIELSDIPQKQVNKIENLLNRRPRKVLNCLTPIEAFNQLKKQRCEIALQT